MGAPVRAWARIGKQARARRARQREAKYKIPHERICAVAGGILRILMGSQGVRSTTAIRKNSGGIVFYRSCSRHQEGCLLT